MWEVVFHPSARAEHRALPAAERAAIDHAVEKLQAMGPVYHSHIRVTSVELLGFESFDHVRGEVRGGPSMRGWATPLLLRPWGRRPRSMNEALTEL